MSYVKIFGTGSLIVVSILLALNYWGSVNLATIPFAHFVDYLYGYLILGGLGALKLFRRRRPEADKLCPQCDSPLQSKPHYVCPQCGDLDFKKKESKPDNNIHE